MAKTRVLIVDDEPNIRDLLATSLRFAGYEIQSAANGAQAVAAVSESEPDIILLDVMLPDMNGFSVTKKLRSAGIQAPILFLTARDDVEDKITGLTVGGDSDLGFLRIKARRGPTSRASTKAQGRWQNREFLHDHRQGYGRSRLCSEPPALPS